MPLMRQKAFERIRHPASRGDPLMTNTWSAGINSWLRRYGVRREASWPTDLATSPRRPEPCKLIARPSVTTKSGRAAVSDANMAWGLADAADLCLTGYERTMTFVELGCKEYLLVINRILNTVVQSRTTLPSTVLDMLTRWLDGYVGSPDEPQLRAQLAQIRAQRQEPKPIRAHQAQCAEVRSTAASA
ncbi:hypothetical protein ABQE93_06640 [Mycolicibacterium sp. XJ662]